MKNILLFIAVLFSMTALGQIPRNGLIAEYPFSGNANDITGNGHDGIVHNATLTKDRVNNDSSAYSFDGATSYISTNQLIVGTSTPRSICLWFLFEDLSLSNVMFTEAHDNGSGSSGPWEFRGVMEGSYVNEIWFEAQPEGMDWQYARSKNIILAPNTWYHAVGIYTGYSIKLYINGVLQDTVPCGTLTNSQNWSETEIGRDAWDQNQSWHGKLDDIVVYNRILTDAEILQIYGYPAGINENTTESLSFFPNPATDIVNVKGNVPEYIKILNVYGQILKEAKNTSKISMVNLSKGLYILQLINENGIVVKNEKILKE